MYHYQQIERKSYEKSANLQKQTEIFKIFVFQFLLRKLFSRKLIRNRSLSNGLIKLRGSITKLQEYKFEEIREMKSEILLKTNWKAKEQKEKRNRKKTKIRKRITDKLTGKTQIFRFDCSSLSNYVCLEINGLEEMERL